MPNDKPPPTPPPTFEVHVNVPYDAEGGVLNMKLATAYQLYATLGQIIHEWEESQLPPDGVKSLGKSPPDES